jgi:hypothetical protein
VTRADRCPVCGKPDWCAVARDGNAALCQRVESPRRVGDAGWLHRLREDSWQPPRRLVRSQRLATPEAAGVDLSRLAASYRAAVDDDDLHRFAASLGLSASSLSRLGVGWSAEHRAWSFPMRDPVGHVLGIRLRRPDGFKYAVAGGKDGLFLPAAAEGGSPGPLLVCEGPTDTAALLHMGFASAVGRPACTGGVKLLAELVRVRRPPGVVVVSDADAPGRFGAANLASVLVAYAPWVRVVEPPAGAKDARAWLQAGATRQEVEKAIAAAAARRLVVRAFVGRRTTELQRGGER